MKKLLMLSLLIKASMFAAPDAEDQKAPNSQPADDERTRGLNHFMRKNYKSALQEFSSYLFKNPESAHGYLYRGLSHLALGNEDLGSQDIKRALNKNPGLVVTLKELMPEVVSAAGEMGKKAKPMTTKKGIAIKTKKGPVACRARG